MKRKIAFVQPTLAPYSRPRYEELAKDYDLEIILFFEKEYLAYRPGWQIREVPGCKVEVIDSITVKWKVRNIERGFDINAIKRIPYRLPLLIAKHRPDIVVAYNSTVLLFCNLLKKYLNYKTGLIVEDTIDVVKNKNYITRHIKSAIYRTADFYLPFSTDALKYLEQEGITKNVYRSSWSVDLKYFSKNYDPIKCLEIRKKLNLDGKIAFIIVGQLIPLKGILNLLNAWKELPNAIQMELALIVIGNGPQREDILRFIKQNNIPNIFLLGQKPYEEVINYYYSSDVFILPTLQDLFSLVVMEAMACGLPVLTTIYNGSRELIKEGVNGYIFDSTNILDMKRIIISIFSEKDKLAYMGKESLKIITNYSHKRVIDNLKYVLKTV